MNKYILMLACLLLIAKADAKFLDLVTEEVRSHHILDSAAVYQDNLFYINASENRAGLWVYDTQLKTHQQLLSTVNATSISEIYSEEDGVYFFYQDPMSSQYELWMTKGTVETTVAVNSQLQTPIRTFVKNGDTILLSSYSSVLLLNEGGSHMIELDSPDVSNHCFFNENNFIISNSPNEGDRELIQINAEGEVSQISTLPQYRVVKKMLMSAGYCFILHGEGLDRTNKVTRVDENGAVFDLDISEVKSLVKLGNHTFASGKLNEETAGVFKFNPDGSEVLKQVSSSQYAIPSLMTVGDHILKEDYQSIIVFDEDLNEMSQIEKDDSNLTAFNSRLLTNNASGITLYPNGVLSQAFELRGFILESIVSSAYSDAYFLQLKDKSSGVSGTYAIKDSPVIGSSIIGNWFDPMFKNQGIMARHGKRSDGSKYIFLTVLTFKSGEPYWLSGMAELSTKGHSKTIELVSYEGLDFMQMDATPAQEVVGQIKLMFEDCDHMTADLTYDNETTTMNLQRMDDNKHKRYCFSPVTR